MILTEAIRWIDARCPKSANAANRGCSHYCCCFPTPPPPCPAGFYSMAAETGAREKVEWFTIEAMVGSLMPLLLYRHSEEVARRSFNMY